MTAPPVFACRPLFKILILGCLAAPVYGLTAPSPQTVDLDTVLDRAQAYVDAYELELGLIVGREEYVQDARWMGQSRPREVVARERRRLSSDFLLLPVGPRWYGVRNVLRVDGIPVEEPEELPDSVEALIAAARDTRYDIGEFQRTFNVPTFALTFFRPGNLGRFSFDKRGERTIDDVDVWEIGFNETFSPTLVRGSNGEDRFANGRLWLSPETGAIIRTEIVFEVDSDGIPYRVRMLVDYDSSPSLGMLVPDRMQESYDREDHSVSATADYFDFQRFGVDVGVADDVELFVEP